jgi:zinc finger protein 830
MSDVRALLKQTRQTRRITHPYAKYTAQGALYCTACTQKVASEALWETHSASTQHKDKVKDVIRESQRKAKRGIAATAMEEEDAQESRKRVRIAEPEVEEQEVEEVQAEVEPEEEGLPADFFDEGSKPEKIGVDEDEWAKFQADIAETITTQQVGEEDEEEEMRRGIVEEFEEMNTLEDRVERLKKRRAELQKASKEANVVLTVPAVPLDDDEEGEIEEEWW